MNTALKKSLQVVLFVAIFVVCYVYVGFALTPKNADDVGGEKFFQSTALYYEDKNTLDMLFCGNSDLRRGFVPTQFYEETGITSYNGGQDKQSLKAILNQLNKVVKKQDLKVLALETDCFYWRNTEYTGTNVYNDIWWSAAYLYHSRWKDLEFKDFFQGTDYSDNFHKGYAYTHENSNFKLQDDFMKEVTNKCEKIEKSVLRDIEKIHKICKKNNIEIFYFTIPSPNSWTIRKHNAVQALADEYGVKYLDLNLPTTGFDFDYANNYMDWGNHCNYDGAKVVTSFVGQYIVDNFNLEDHRADKKYAKWEKSKEKHKQYIEKQKNKNDKKEKKQKSKS